MLSPKKHLIQQLLEFPDVNNTNNFHLLKEKEKLLNQIKTPCAII
jgi:hypothetical protein